mmetsp:Transcript_45398/g.90887  ORF Transcript_45398/g.90887 Transcript_45398/m.90887 type:complete len:241 (-) Transcript_45398:338-1060(-)
MTNYRSVKFFFDFVSPYAYMSWTRAKRLDPGAGIAFDPKPILFAGLLQRWGQLGPAEIAPKRQFVFRDTLRRAVEADIPLRFPPSHPFAPLLPLRATTAVLNTPERDAVITNLFEACWAESRDISQPETVRGALEAAGVPDVEAVMKASVGRQLKTELKANTTAATEQGVFGVPTWVTQDGELFWGDDQLPSVIRHLNGEDLLLQADVDMQKVLNRPGKDRFHTTLKMGENVIPGSHFGS